MKKAFLHRESFWEEAKFRLDFNLGFGEQWAGKEGTFRREKDIQAEGWCASRRANTAKSHQGEVRINSREYKIGSREGKLGRLADGQVGGGVGGTWQSTKLRSLNFYINKYWGAMDGI